VQHSIYLFFFCLHFFPLLGNEFFLRDNLQKALPGDYIVTSSCKTETLFHIYAKNDHTLTIEEISVPESKRPKGISWKQWVVNQAPGNTNWVMYEINLHTGQMGRYYSFTKKNWFEIPEADNFLGKLLSLKFMSIDSKLRKRMGPKAPAGPDQRPFWQPTMIVEGQKKQGVLFHAWQTRWPRDNSDLAGKIIEIYTPQDTNRYPSYFPYWLQINGVTGKAKIRIIDSGHQLESIRPPLSDLT
jgi:hypothetical protein